MLDMAAMNLMIAYDYDKWLLEEYSDAWTGNEGRLSLSGPYTDHIGKTDYIIKLSWRFLHIWVNWFRKTGITGRNGRMIRKNIRVRR